jgi:predicted permease
MLKDLRHGFRVLMQAKGWTTVVVLSLAVGIGANAAIFTAINGLMLKKLPVRDPDGLVRLRWAGGNDMVNNSSDYGSVAALPNGENVQTTFSYPMFEHLRLANQTLSDIAASVPRGGVTVTIDGRAETASALLTTSNYYEMLGVNARIGRTLTSGDDLPSAPPVAMLSHRYWQSRFGSSSDIVGKSIRVNTVPVTIVGVAQQEFTGTQRVTSRLQDVLIPLKLDDQIGSDGPRRGDATHWWVQVIGRLKPDVRADRVRGNLEGVFQRQARAGMEAHLASLPEAARNLTMNQNRTAVPRLIVESGNRGVYDVNAQQVRAIEILASIVALVFLLVCANVANLLLSRVASRQKEISIRLSMGATRARLIRQLLTESLLLSAMGGAAGFFIARWGQALLPAPVGTSAPPDWRIVAFTAGVTAIAGVVFGIAPALRGTRMEVGTALKESSRSVAGANTALSRGLLVLQVAISLVLLVGAGLFLRTLDNLRNVDIGWNPQNLVFVRVDTEGAQLDNDGKLRYFQDGMDRLRVIPGVRHATVSKPTLMSGGVSGTGFYVQGRVYPKGKDSYVEGRDNINRVVVAPNYFEAMGIPIVAGRGFTDRDNEKAPEVAIINQAAARKFFPDENPIGRNFGASVDDTPNTQVVGILRDVRYNDLREEPPPTMYIPHRQHNPEDLVFSIRSAGDPTNVMNAVRSAVSAANPNIPVVAVQTQMSMLEQRFAHEKVLAQAYTLFSGIALFVAAIGLFGLMSYNVSRRTREIGIRMAMGAESRAVLALVLRESMLLVIVGSAIGIAISLVAGRLVASQLFGLEPTDLATMVAAMVVMLAVSAAAGYVPARRAARVDPMVALRYE